MSKGLDSAKSLAAGADKLYAAGYRFVIRYTFNHSAFKDLLTRTEATALSKAGLYVVTVYEDGMPTTSGYFTPARGAKDAAIAFNRATLAGQPPGKPIYFAVDYDAKPFDVFDYFDALNAHMTALGSHYDVDCYGSQAVIEALKARGSIKRGWRSQSTGFGGFNDPSAKDDALWQGRETTVLGLDVDLDISNGDAGGWQAT